MRLSDARVLVLGMGGLGCPASLALAQAGARRMTLVDPDVVELSNLHRQPWHRTPDLGRAKVDSAAEKLAAAFPGLALARLRERVGARQAPSLFAEHDLVIDAVDATDAKFAFSDAAVATGTPLVYAGVVGMEGQVMAIHRDGPCLRCLFEAPPGAASVPTCAGAGVLGSLAGLVGGLQALVARALLEAPLSRGGSSLLRVEAVSLRQRRVEVRRQDDCACCGGSARALVPA